jgi:ABC-type uncharacterized transport system substrate-binding protein
VEIGQTVALRLTARLEGRPTKVYRALPLELVVNLKTAKALGVTIPSEVLLQANRVIE